MSSGRQKVHSVFLPMACYKSLSLSEKLKTLLVAGFHVGHSRRSHSHGVLQECKRHAYTRLFPRECTFSSCSVYHDMSRSGRLTALRFKFQFASKQGQLTFFAQILGWERFAMKHKGTKTTYSSYFACGFCEYA